MNPQDKDFGIYELAKNNTENRNLLFEVFQQENDPYTKLGFARILCDLRYEGVIPYLLDTALTDEDLDNRIEACVGLIKFERSEGPELLWKILAPELTQEIVWLRNKFTELAEGGNLMAQAQFERLTKELGYVWQWKPKIL